MDKEKRKILSIIVIELIDIVTHAYARTFYHKKINKKTQLSDELLTSMNKFASPNDFQMLMQSNISEWMAPNINQQCFLLIVQSWFPSFYSYVNRKLLIQTTKLLDGTDSSGPNNNSFLQSLLRFSFPLFSSWIFQSRVFTIKKLLALDIL